jgi:lysophospholipase L1-like esterase
VSALDKFFDAFAPTLAALRDWKTPAHGLTKFVVERGFPFEFDANAKAADDDNSTILPSDRTPGAWKAKDVVPSEAGRIAGSLGFSTATLEDANSLVPGRVDAPEWRVSSPGKAPACRRIADVATDATRSLVWVNCDAQLAVPGAYLERLFTPPTGVTAISLEVDDLKLPPGVGSSPNVTLELRDATGTQLYASQAITPTATAMQYATASVAVTPGIEYRARLVVGQTGQVAIGRLRVKPTTSSVAFWTSGFYRIPVSPDTLHSNNEAGFSNPRFWQHSEMAHVELVTNTTSIYVEYYNNVGLYVTPVPREAAAISVDDKHFAVVSPSVDKIDYQLTTLPSPRQVRRVRVSAGPQASAQFTGTPPRGTYLCGIYVPSASTICATVPPPPRETVVLYGDSKMAGFYSSAPARDSLAPQLRAVGIRTIMEAYGGRTLVTDVSGTLSVAACDPFARKLARNAPSHVVVAIGRNDFFNATYTQANWQTQLGNLCDALNSVAPQAKQLLLKFSSESSEPNNGGGDTMDGWRGVMDTVASTRRYAKVLDGKGLWTIAQAGSFTSDTVHPNDAGYELIGRLIANEVSGGAEPYPWTPLRLGGLKVWLRADLAPVAAGMTSVVSSGTSPPVVTLSGTATLPMSLVIAVTTSGALGTSKFKYSVDGGLSWVATEIATAASVLLGNTGITASFASGTYANDNIYTANTRIATWTDQGTLGNSPTQATGGSQPEYQHFSAANLRRGLKWGNAGGMTKTGFTLAQPFTVFCVAKCANQSTLHGLFGGSTSNNPVLYTNTSTTVALTAGAQFTATLDATKMRTYALTFNGASSEIRIDGGAVVATGNAGSQGFVDLVVGRDPVNVLNWDDVIAEFFVIDHAASTAEKTAVESYLRAMYGTW